MMQHDTRPSTLMVAQRMHYTAQRLLHIQRTAPVALLVERDLQAHIEDTQLYGAVRDGRLVELPWNLLTDGEQQDARNRMFDPNNCGW